MHCTVATNFVFSRLASILDKHASYKQQISELNTKCKIETWDKIHMYILEYCLTNDDAKE